MVLKALKLSLAMLPVNCAQTGGCGRVDARFTLASGPRPLDTGLWTLVPSDTGRHRHWSLSALVVFGSGWCEKPAQSTVDNPTVDPTNSPDDYQEFLYERKRLELLKELLPDVSRAAILWNAANPYAADVFRETDRAARTLRITLQSLEVRSPDDFDTAFEAAKVQRPEGLITVEDPLTVGYRKQIVDFAARNRLPAIHGVREFVEAGGLIAYGASLSDLSRRAATYVDKILKGTKPADLPIQQPTKFEFIVNLSAAKALGLTMPPSLLARADEVIE